MRMFSWLRHLKSGSNGTDPHVTGLFGGGHANVIVVLPMLYSTCGEEALRYRQKTRSPCVLARRLGCCQHQGGRQQAVSATGG